MPMMLGARMVIIGGRLQRRLSEQLPVIALDLSTPTPLAGNAPSGTHWLQVEIVGGNGDGTLAVTVDATGKLGAVTGSGTTRTVSTSASLSGTTAGDYTVTLTYSGDSANAAAVTAQAEVTVQSLAALTVTWNPSSPSVPDNTSAGVVVATATLGGGNGDGVLTITSDPSAEFQISARNLRTTAGGNGLDAGDVGIITVTGT